MTRETNSGVRIEYLDGMRGVAILLVVLFHAFARWPLLVPYGTTFSDFFLAKYGWLGVELFFMISGFVIYMTLEKCRTFSDFIQRRWLRLFPAMVLVSAIVYFSSGLLQERPAGPPILSDIFPGLLFIEPSWIGKLFNIKQGVLEGAFWSLFVEVKFYFLFGGLYFLFKSRVAKAGLLLAFIGSIIAWVAARYLGQTFAVVRYFDLVINGYLSFSYAGWFLVGVLTFDLYRHSSRRRLILTLFLGVVATAYTSLGHIRHDFTVLFGLALVSLYVGSIYSNKVRWVLSTRFLLFIGFISYPFYLFHENFMIAIIIKIGKVYPQIPGVLLPLFPFLIVCFVAFVISKYLERPMRYWIKASIDFIKSYVLKKVSGTRSNSIR